MTNGMSMVFLLSLVLIACSNALTSNKVLEAEADCQGETLASEAVEAEQENGGKSSVLVRAKRQIITADIQTSYDNELAPTSVAIQLIISVNVLLIETIGWTTLGIIFDFYKSINADNPDTLRQTEVFEGMLGQQGILNNMFRIWRNVIFGFVLRFLINLFTYPTETITDLSTRGLNMYSERTFTPTFTTNNFQIAMFDGLNGIIGWAALWVATQYMEGREVFVFKRSVDEEPEAPEDERSLEASYQRIIDNLENRQWQRGISRLLKFGNAGASVM